MSRLPLGPTCWDCSVPNVLSRMSCPSCLVWVVLSKMLCPGCPLSTGTVVPSWLPYLSWMSCTRYFLSTAAVVPSRLSCLSCPVLAAIFWPFCLCFLSSLYYSVSLSYFPVPVLLSTLSYFGCPVPAFCPGCPLQDVLYQLSCLAVLSQLSHPDCPVPAALSQLPSFSSCSAQTPLVLSFMMLLSCPGSPILCPV